MQRITYQKFTSIIQFSMFLGSLLLAVGGVASAQMKRMALTSTEHPKPAARNDSPLSFRKFRDLDSMGLPDPEKGQGSHSPFNRGLRQQIGRMTASGSLNTLATWSDSFAYHGLEFEYTMVGTDPRDGSATTVIPTVLIPLRFVLADGNVFDPSADLVDGQTPLQATIDSPIFQNYHYIIGGTDVGNTQFGDAFQRANFWNSVSTKARDYHVLLGGPDVTPVQTIFVPSGKFFYAVDPSTGQIFPSVEDGFLDDHILTLIHDLNLSPSSLEIFATGIVSNYSSWGYHSFDYDGSTFRTYIVTTFQPHDAVYYGQHVPDIFVLSHEIAEWMDDPLGNRVPGWEFAGDTSVRCDSSTFLGGDLLEVADPFEFLDPSANSIQIGSHTYHVTDAAFLDFFTREKSRSVNGQYSLFHSIDQPTPPCTGHIYFPGQFFEFPGAYLTSVTGINNRGAAVGYYFGGGRWHGFLHTGSGYSTIDVPGALRTFPSMINDTGLIVGSFKDVSGFIHGFLYSRGNWSQIDFPGSSDTIASGINSAGDIVGTYDNFQPLSHGFVIRHGQFQRIDTPYGPSSSVGGINNFGVIAGYGWNDPAGPYRGFRLKNDAFTEFAFPAAASTVPFAINDLNDLVGVFIDPDGSESLMITVYGYSYLAYGDPATETINGNNDIGQVCGIVYDPYLGRYFGFIGDLPLANGADR